MGRLVRFTWATWFRGSHVVLVVALGVMLGANAGTQLVGVADTLAATSSLWDALLLAFWGPSAREGNFLSALFWLVIPATFLYTIAPAVRTALWPLVVLKSGARQRWLLSCVLLLLLQCAWFTALIVSSVLVGAAVVLPNATPADALLQAFDVTTLTTYQVVLWALVLMFSTLAVLALLQLVLALVLGRAIYAFIALVGLCVASVSFGTLALWLPPTQMILRQHHPFEASASFFTLGWSLAYNGLAIGLLLLIAGGVAATYDFTRSFDTGAAIT